jgi:small multidrug resistance pump
MKWLLLLFGIVAELLGSTFMKMSHGFTELYPSILTFIFWAIGLSIFMFVLKSFDLSIAYALWAGLGILGVSVIGMVFFKEPYSALKLISICIIAAGAIMLNISDILLHK